MSRRQNCIVSYIDMSGVKGMLARSSKDAVILLQRMHTQVQTAAQKLTMHEEVCFWNDSVVLVGSVDGPPERYEQIMREVCIIKAAVDKVKRGYAICVKGQPFPPPEEESWNPSVKPRLIYLHASSLAFSNCFLIEERAKEKKWRRDWYIDDRIIKHIDARRPDWTEFMHLWPRNRECILHMYSGKFWVAKGDEGIAQQNKSSVRGTPRR